MASPDLFGRLGIYQIVRGFSTFAQLSVHYHFCLIGRAHSLMNVFRLKTSSEEYIYEFADYRLGP